MHRILFLATALLAADAFGQVSATLDDFFGPGTQPETLNSPILSANNCRFCHGNFDPVTEPTRPWAASLMGQAARDPVYHAALAVANQDADFAGDLCLRCHTPGGWIEGRSTPTDGSALIDQDFEGVSCHVCHRMVDPIYQPGVSPAEDQAILTALSDPPVNPHSAHMVLDPEDRRRGPYDLGDFFIHDWLPSPFHRKSEMCATCHDVSNPLFSRQPDGTYDLNALDAPAPSFDKLQQFPTERTYSEWLGSDFADGPVDLGGRFGGTKILVSTCQDCHMPQTTGFGCFFGEERTDLHPHYFPGGNTWVLDAVRNLYDDSETLLDPNSVASAKARTIDLLTNASDLELSATSTTVTARVVNESGHKLPTGYPEGRRMWVNARFYDAADALLAEYGAYDSATATLTLDTKVYEAKLGLDAELAALTGKPEGPGFHFALSNTWYLDNRIPPRGFANAEFAALQAAPVAYSYADGQHWDDTIFDVPASAVRAEVRVYFQTTSREYIEFLRDENTTNAAGQTAYDQWVATGRSAPIEIDFAQIVIPGPPCPNPQAGCDNSDIFPLGGDCVVDLSDLGVVLANYAPGMGGKTRGQGDIFPLVMGDGVVDLSDLGQILTDYNVDCR